MIFSRRSIMAGMTALPFLSNTAFAGTEALRIAVLKFGTVNWELDTILREGLAAQYGVDLQVRGVASGSAGKIAFESGGADMIVSDWIWVARQRAAGRDYVFAPYSRSVGSLIVAGDSPARDITDLRGARIGVAGGPLDKGWLILQAHGRAQRIDLARDAEPVFGAPPLLMQQGLSGALDAVLTYWHFEARMRAQGFRRLIRVGEAAAALGLPGDIPLLGYVFREALLRERPGMVAGFLAASAQAKSLLAEDDAVWDALRPRMKAETPEIFEALRTGFRKGIPHGPVDEDGAAALFAKLAELGGERLVGEAKALPAGVFHVGS